MKYAEHREPEPSHAAVIEILQRLWHQKLSTIALIEKWTSETSDSEIRAGLANQLIDERTHARLVGEQIRRLGGRIGGRMPMDGVSRVFSDAISSRQDLFRLFALYRGVKSYTVDRCNHLMPFVDASLAQVLERLSRDDERHIRWADLRLQRLLTYETMRECTMRLSHIRTGLESAWDRQWRRLSFASAGRRGA